MRSFDARLDIHQSIAPASYSAAQNGTGVDLIGCDANIVEISTGAFGGTATAKIQESAVSGSGYTDVDDSQLVGVTGNASGFALAASSLLALGYIGNKQFVRVILTASTTGNLVSASVVRMAKKLVP
jgi:hypothetical protein